MALIGCLGCCVYPHGRKSTVALLLAIGSYLTLNGGMWSCLFMEIDGYLYEKEPFVWEDTIKLGKKSRVGLFSYEQYSIGSAGQENLCTPYSTEQRDDFLDGPFKAARAFAVLAHVFVGAAMIGLLVLSCAYLELFIVKMLGWLLIAGSVCEALIFLVCLSDIAASPYDGSVWWGGLLVVFASLTALLAGFLTLRLPVCEEQPSPEEQPATKVSPPRGRQNQQTERKMPPGTEITTSAILPDGRTKYTTTKWNKDGSKTVTEMIE